MKSQPDWRAALGAMPPGGIAVFQPARLPLAGRRIARALLEEAAVLGGGQVLSFPGGDLLLGSAAAPGQRAAQAIGGLLGRPPETWLLPQGQAAVEARGLAAQQAEPAQTWSLAALEAHCAALPIRDFARLTFFAEGEGTTPVAQRLSAAPLALGEPDLEAMAGEFLCRRLLAALTSPAERDRLPALRPGLRLILDLPPGGLAQGSLLRAGAADDPNGPVALLPLAALADPVALDRLASGLRQAGWTVGLLAPDPMALHWVAAEEFLWAVPAQAAPPMVRPPRLIVLGHPAPAWCRVPGIWHEGEGPPA